MSSAIVRIATLERAWPAGAGSEPELGLSGTTNVDRATSLLERPSTRTAVTTSCGIPIVPPRLRM
jgi:hypothetical protein